jgi:hypothetical protein
MVPHLQWYRIVIMHTAYHFSKNHFFKVNPQM